MMSRSCTARKGITNVELLTGMSLLAIVLTLCTILFISSLKKFRNSSTEIDIKNAATVGLARFGRDFRETSITHIVNNAEGVTMAGKYFYFPSPRDRNGNYQRYTTGETNFCSWIIYYIPQNEFITLDNNEKVYYLARRVINPASLITPPAGLDMNTLNGAQVVARNVTKFQINKAVISNSVYSYDLLIETKGYNAGNVNTFRVNETFTVYDLVNFIKR
ncbi:MAG: type II secretion system protein J [Candidatus Xenobiia bacterium LiM19]